MAIVDAGGDFGEAVLAGAESECEGVGLDGGHYDLAHFCGGYPADDGLADDYPGLSAGANQRAFILLKS